MPGPWPRCPARKLVALVSRSAGQRRSKLADELGLDAATSTPTWPRSWPAATCDIVIVTTPSGAHLEPAVAAAEAGKHVVVEKPLEITLERCDRIIDACDQQPASSSAPSSRRASATPTVALKAGGRRRAASAG